MPPNQPVENKSIEIFFSYSPKDKELRDELAKHLRLLERQKIIKTWSDSDITAGSESRQEVKKKLNSAHIILLLISVDFINSEFCWGEELGLAMQRHEAKEARVIPVILREVDWHEAPFGKLKALPKDAVPVTNWGNRDQAFTDIARGIRRVVEELAPDSPDSLDNEDETFDKVPKENQQKKEKFREADAELIDNTQAFENSSSSQVATTTHGGEPFSNEPHKFEDKNLWKTFPRRWQERISWRNTFLTSAGITILVIALRLSGVFQASELLFFDMMMRNQPIEKQDDRLLIVKITKKDIEDYAKKEAPKNSASLADTFIYQLLNKLLQSNPRVIGIDNYRYADAEGELKQLINNEKTDNRLIFICKFPDEKSNERDGYNPPPDAPIEQVGLSDFLDDYDRVIRRQIIQMGTPVNEKTTDSTKCKNKQEELMDSFSFKIAQKYLAVDKKEYKRFGGENGNLVSANTVLQPLDNDTQNGYHLRNLNGYQILLNYRFTDGDNKPSLENIARTFTLSQVLKGDVVTEKFIRDKIVLIGTPTHGFDSLLPTPFSTRGADSQIHGLFIQAQMVSQLVSAALGERPLLKVWQMQYDMLWILSWSVVGAIIFQLYKKPQTLLLLTQVAGNE